MGINVAPQPGLRAYIILPRLPEGCASSIVPDDRAEPHLHAGDVAVIDPDDRTPDHGDLFLVQWTDGRQQIVETRRFKNSGAIVGWDGVTEYWQLCWSMKMWSVDGSASRAMRWADGPYSTEHVASKIVGRVVAIVQPAFEGPIREVA